MHAHRTFVMFARVLVALTVLVAAGTAHAAWILNGNVATTSADVISPPHIVPDGSGGAIVVYEELYTIGDIIAQRYDAQGNLLWGPTGVVAQTGPDRAVLNAVVADDRHGAVIARSIVLPSVFPMVALQWLRADGSSRFGLWGVELHEMYTGPQQDAVLHMLDDGTCAVALLMEDGLGGPRKVWAQAIDSLGVKQWGAGVPVSTGAGAKTNLAIASDGAGGVVIAWQDFRNGSDWDVYAQRLDANGVPAWAAGGVPVMAAAMSQLNPQLVPIGALGTMVIWEDRQGASPDIVAGRLRDTGTMAWIIAACDAAGIQNSPVACTDGNDGAVIAWEDQRDGNRDIYAIRVTGGGSTSGWPNDGEVVANGGFEEDRPSIAHDGANGAVIAWRTDLANSDHIYTTRLDGSGAFPWLQWSTVCSLGGSRESPLVVKSNEDFVVAWRDGRPGDIFAQRIDDATGYWGIVVPPAITSVTDSPGDGGGNVDIAWNACDRDNLTTDVREYHVFRSLDQSSWTQVATVDATGLASYALSNVPTTADNLTHYFYIDAVGGGLLQHHFPSQTGSGVSIDDPPNIPLSLNVEKIGSWYYLNWVPPSPCVGGAVCDVVGYRVYRRVMGGPAALSPTDDWTLIGESQNPQFTDQTVSPGEPQEWAVSALDAGGREGAMTAAFRIEDTTSDVGDVPARFVVAPNVPNPFGHSTELVFALPDERDVRVDVYDVAGRLVHSRSLGRQPSGWNRVQLPSGSLASGVYFYRVTAGRDVSTRKMVVRR